jgi:hypothetical protein
MIGIPQDAPFQCDVLIWRCPPRFKALGRPGHAAVLLRRAPNQGPWRRFGFEVVPAIDSTQMRYISFWPRNGADANKANHPGAFLDNPLRDYRNEISEETNERLASGDLAPLDSQVVVGAQPDGEQIWGRKPIEPISILGLSGIRPTKLGLNLNKMVDFAVTLQGIGEFEYKYISRSRNCAGITVRALVAGGGAVFAEFGGNYSSMNVYTNPNDAQHWSEAVQRGVNSVNAMLEMLQNATAKLPPGRPDLMSYREWRSISSVAWTIRGPETTAIDKALQQYHAASWTTQYLAKLKSLVQIIESISDHMLKRTKRDGAYLELAREVMRVVAAVARSADQPWSTKNYYAPVPRNPIMPQNILPIPPLPVPSSRPPSRQSSFVESYYDDDDSRTLSSYDNRSLHSYRSPSLIGNPT